ncbi:surface lipoprotein assembly modifier [Pseudogemmobacter humi]|uniref:Surface lipoprotein assembly modifier C-terminal domain-containing protein n=1 Tax=Pseudogemmobacter humi TaxID=2483812 RepID=A0A3P5X2Y7_9RHOB|nr:surface lipoprotein assembly modifier [Pseudogemmobacter humi]VDC28560.1 hypothetical protein XINFAN_02140 [Pseudogemmobacter humi]
MSRLSAIVGIGKLLAMLPVVYLLGIPAVTADVLRVTPDEALLTAREAWRAGDYEVANRIARALLLADPDSVYVQLLLASTEPKLGRPQEGLTAGRKAWKIAREEEAGKALRYEIARTTALAALGDDRPMLAQFWLRRSLDVAPDDKAYEQSGQDLAWVRNRTPWRWSIDLEAGPSDNLNGGARDDVFRIGDFDLGTLDDGAEALSGHRANLRFGVQRILPASATAQSVLSFSLEMVKNRIDGASQAKAGSVRSRDLDRSRIALGLRRDMLVGAAERPVSLRTEVGYNWIAGERAGPHLGFEAQALGWSGADGSLWVAIEVERNWRDTAPEVIDVATVALIGERPIRGGEGRLSLALTGEIMRSDYVNSTYDSAHISLGVDPGWTLGPGKLSFNAFAGWRDYENYSLGFAWVTGGRTDRSLGVSVDVALEAWDVMGFAPVVSLRHGRTESNVSRFETSTTSVSFAISSVF